MMPTEEFCRAVSTIRDIERLDNDDPDVLGDDSYDYLQTLLWAASTIVTICENQTNETEKKAFTYTDKLTKQIESQSKEISKLTFNLAAGQATIKRYSETIERKEEEVKRKNKEMSRNIEGLSQRIKELEDEITGSKSTMRKDKKTIEELSQEIRVLEIAAVGDKKMIKRMSKRIESENNKTTSANDQKTIKDLSTRVNDQQEEISNLVQTVGLGKRRCRKALKSLQEWLEEQD